MVPPSGRFLEARLERPPPRTPIRRPRHRRNGAAQDRKRQEPRAEFIRRSAMALNLSQKQEVVAELADVAAKAHSLVAAEYAGITVGQMTAMRKKARENGVFLKVVKNTLASRAVEGTEYECVKDALVGPLLYAFSTGRPRRCRSSDQGIRQGQRQAAGQARVDGRPAVSGAATSTCSRRCRPASRPWPCWHACSPSRRACSLARSRRGASWPTQQRRASAKPRLGRARRRRPEAGNPADPA